MPTFGSFSGSFSFGRRPKVGIGNPVDAVGNFTVAWWQFMTAETGTPRVFSVGANPSASIAASLESGTFYLRFGSTSVFTFTYSGILNTWTHFAITRTGNQLRVFKGGVAQTDSTSSSTVVTDTTNINDTTNALAIGVEGTGSAGSYTPVANTYFTGRITNFHWVKGTSRYQSNFTPPYPTTVLANTKLLLLASAASSKIDDSSSSPITLTNNGNVGWSSTNPTGGQGGSMTFNGSSQYLTAPAGANWALGAPA